MQCQAATHGNNNKLNNTKLNPTEPQAVTQLIVPPSHTGEPGGIVCPSQIALLTHASFDRTFLFLVNRYMHGMIRILRFPN